MVTAEKDLARLAELLCDLQYFHIHLSHIPVRLIAGYNLFVSIEKLLVECCSLIFLVIAVLIQAEGFIQSADKAIDSAEWQIWYFLFGECSSSLELYCPASYCWVLGMLLS